VLVVEGGLDRDQDDVLLDDSQQDLVDSVPDVLMDVLLGPPASFDAANMGATTAKCSATSSAASHNSPLTARSPASHGRS
jgi:hypothetical protein